MKGNNRAAKREEQHQTHNRHPGTGKWWKHFSNRKGRRWSNRVRYWQVRGRMEVN